MNYCCKNMSALFKERMAWYSGYDMEIHGIKTLLVRFSDGLSSPNYHDLHITFCPFCGAKT